MKHAPDRNSSIRASFNCASRTSNRRNAFDMLNLRANVIKFLKLRLSYLMKTNLQLLRLFKKEKKSEIYTTAEAECKNIQKIFTEEQIFTKIHLLGKLVNKLVMFVSNSTLVS